MNKNNQLFINIAVGLILISINIDFNTGLPISQFVGAGFIIYALFQFKKLTGKLQTLSIVALVVGVIAPIVTNFFITKDSLDNFNTLLGSLESIDLENEADALAFAKKIFNEMLSLKNSFIISISVTSVASILIGLSVYKINSVSVEFVSGNDNKDKLNNCSKQYFITEIIVSVSAAIMAIVGLSILENIAPILDSQPDIISFATSFIYKLSFVGLLVLPLAVCGIWNLVVLIKLIAMYFREIPKLPDTDPTL